MMKNGENPYKFARLRSPRGLTAEQACDALGYSESVNVLYNIEQGRKKPDDDLVRKMMDVYAAPWLWYEHLRQISPLAAENLPPYELSGASDAYVRMSKEVEDVMIRKQEIRQGICSGFNGNAYDLAREAWEASTSLAELAISIPT